MKTLDENLLSFLLFQVKELRSQFEHGNFKIEPLEEKSSSLRVVAYPISKKIREKEDMLNERMAS